MENRLNTLDGQLETKVSATQEISSEIFLLVSNTNNKSHKCEESFFNSPRKALS